MKKRRKFPVPRRTPEGIEHAPAEILEAPGKRKLPPMPMRQRDADGIWAPPREPEGIEHAPAEILDAPAHRKLPPMPIMALNAYGIYEVIWAPPR
jgi:hypothetical protein